MPLKQEHSAALTMDGRYAAEAVGFVDRKPSTLSAFGQLAGADLLIIANDAVAPGRSAHFAGI